MSTTMPAPGAAASGREDAYAAFLAKKAIVDPPTGVSSIPALPDDLFPFQRDIVNWALRRGRAALFAGTGLGKTLMELSWGSAVVASEGGMVLLFAPLAVSAQVIREAGKFGIPARLVRTQNDCGPGINVTNYQKIEHFDLSEFVGVILDESSILKSETGKYRTDLISACSIIPFRLAATATPAPNDFMELGNHAEFLGVMSYTDMLSTFFTHDGGETQKWRLKGHAENDFWRWMASWSVMLRKPSDLGYEDGAYTLPALKQVHHTVRSDTTAADLIGGQSLTLQERIRARRESVEDRVAFAASIVHDYQTAQDCDQCLRAPKDESAEPNTCVNTGSTIQKSGKDRPSKEKHSMLDDARDTLKTPHSESRQSYQLNSETGRLSETPGCEQNSASPQTNMTASLSYKAAAVPSAQPRTVTPEDGASRLTTATTPEKSAASSAPTATKVSASSETTSIGSTEQLNISSMPAEDPWLIWCGLNTEQDALEKAFFGQCISVRGSMTEDQKEAAVLSWLQGEKPIMISKPSILGFGLNFQHCSNMLFVGLNDSFEQVYQAVRRCWRFGQTKPVTAHFIAAETEGAVVANLKRKESDADRMAAAMVLHTANITKATINSQVRDVSPYEPAVPMTIPSWLGAAA